MSLGTESTRRRRARPGALSAIGSLFVHSAVLAGAVGVAASGPEVDQLVSYNIELVSMPGPDLGDLVVEAPESAPSEAPAPTPQPVVKEPAPAPKKEPPKAPAPSAAQPKPTQARPNPSNGESSGAESGEALNIRIEGLRRDYPLYYNNIILQIKRCFRWVGQGSPETEVYFVINADGTVSDARFVRQSSNPTFNYEALGAVECAGQPGRFGQLPEDLPFDRLPIRFTFRPGTAAGIFR
ncbi:MAG: hypothetical protein EXR95_10490 [Gemmatimonadetes bacterium]|nr:hypothetical protein [Gemmatimonadota bacterium]